MVLIFTQGQALRLNTSLSERVLNASSSQLIVENKVDRVRRFLRYSV